MNPFGSWNETNEYGICYYGADLNNIVYNNLKYIGLLVRDYGKNGDAYNTAKLLGGFLDS